MGPRRDDNSLDENEMKSLAILEKNENEMYYYVEEAIINQVLNGLPSWEERGVGKENISNQVLNGLPSWEERGMGKESISNQVLNGLPSWEERGVGKEKFHKPLKMSQWSFHRRMINSGA